MIALRYRQRVAHLTGENGETFRERQMKFSDVPLRF